MAAANTAESSILKWASSKDGAFHRQESKFRSFVQEGSDIHPPEPERYILYVSYACPWAHRTLIVRALKGLERVIDVSVVDYLLGENGWKFSTNEETLGCIPDPVYNSNHVRDLYHRADPNYQGRYTVPILWDKKRHTIVNNESAEIIRMLNSQFNKYATNPKLDLYPSNLQTVIDELNNWIYDEINNGVYKAGFATAQDKYEINAKLVHSGLLKCERLLTNRPFIAGDMLTEADVRLFTTVLRYEPVYFGHFKCNLISIRDLPHLFKWLCKLYQLPGIKETINMEHIKKHYYMSHKQINPTGIVPLSNGPNLELH